MQYWHFPSTWWDRNPKNKIINYKISKRPNIFSKVKVALKRLHCKVKKLKPQWNFMKKDIFFFFVPIKEVMELQTNHALTKNKQTDSKYEMWNWKDSKKTIFFQYFAKVVFKVFLSVSHWVYILLDMCSLFLYVKH